MRGPRNALEMIESGLRPRIIVLQQLKRNQIRKQIRRTMVDGDGLLQFVNRYRHQRRRVVRLVAFHRGEARRRQPEPFIEGMDRCRVVCAPQAQGYVRDVVRAIEIQFGKNVAHPVDRACHGKDGP